MSFTSFFSRARMAMAVAALGFTGSAQAQILCFRAELDGSQEVPPVATSATGTAFFIMDQAANSLTYDIQFNGLTAAENNAHIHGFAAPGVNAGVLFALPLGNPKSGTVFYSEAQEQGIITGMTYVNIHSALPGFPSGEIRGQILLDTSSVFMTAKLDGAQEVPPVATPATGAAFFMVDTAANRMDMRIEFSNLTGPQSLAHIHGFVSPGVNGGVQFNLGVGSPKNATWFYNQADEASILAGLTYVNIHTNPGFPSGEIRGQITAACSYPQTFCTAKSGLTCGTPSISWSGAASATANSGFVVTAQPARSCKSGIFLYNRFAGPPQVFQGGTLCVFPQGLRRAGSTNSGGTPGPNCDGAFSIDMNAFAQNAWVVPDCAGAPAGIPPSNPAAFLTNAGTSVYGQFWGRDSVGTGSFVSDGIMYFVNP